MKEKILFHVCCAPCLLPGLKKLNDYELYLYFPNSNIYPEHEFLKRLNEVKKLSFKNKIHLIVEDYEHKAWLDFIKGLEKEPEGKNRCLKCFEFNLEKSAKKAKELGIKKFTTSLTTGREKNSKKVFFVAKQIAKKYDLEFLDIDFKKQNGNLYSVKESRRLGLYRQDYCGCEFSFAKKALNSN